MTTNRTAPNDVGLAIFNLGKQLADGPKHDLYAPSPQPPTIGAHRADGPVDESLLAVAYVGKHVAGRA